MAGQTSLDIVKILRTDGNRFTWTRQGRNGKVTHMADMPYSQKHSAIIAAVRENPDVYRENVRDMTSGKMRPCTSKAVQRLKSKDLGPVSKS